MRISPHKAALVYQYKKQICEHPDRIIFKNCHIISEIIEIDLNDEKERQKLIDMSFYVRSEIGYPIK